MRHEIAQDRCGRQHRLASTLTDLVVSIRAGRELHVGERPELASAFIAVVTSQRQSPAMAVRSSWRSPRWLFAIALLQGCRCGDAREAPPEVAGPTMPTGMLAPLPDAPPLPPPETPAERLSMARGKKGTDAAAVGQWVELRLARPDEPPARPLHDGAEAVDSRFLSIDAMTLLHEPFARALPGFDLFLPRLFDAAALGRLHAELSSVRRELGAVSSVAAAKALWGNVSNLVQSLPDDASWQAARSALLVTIDELSRLAEALEKKGQGLWVLGI